MSNQIVCPSCSAINRVPDNKPAHAAKCGKCKSRLFPGKPVELTAANFNKHISKSSVPVVVDFWAEWCGPCKMMGPEFAKAATALEPDFRMAKLNTEAAQNIAAQYAIQSIPMLMIFKNGKVIAQQPGAMQAGQIENWVRSNS
ncbi:MAG TPA: thioredoxin TrxC [Devosia sp.]|nr:thioredoxin TrxC [Devosia sp.]